VIGITEGLLSRLNRSQIEAVVAHEAAHIVSGDSRAATVVSSLSELYEESLGGVGAVLRGTRGRGGVPLLLVYFVLQLTNLLSKLLRAFLSRQREYRADAVAGRLTRNPLALAEALKLISSDWHGSGAQGERLESLFIVSPRFSHLDEAEGLVSDIFSTHPPVKSRIAVLLGMAHLDEANLEEGLKNFKRVTPVAMAEFKAETVDQAATPKGCPHCKEALEGVNYEGAPILKCPHCQGVLAEERDIRRILVRKDKTFSDETQRQFKVLLDSKGKFNLKENDAKSAWVLDCPQCGHLMRRQFFVYSYPVEIDRCPYCTCVWLDKEELELLQYIYEHKEEYLF
jgi:Zn-finger nucleic acid-binding protein